MIEEFLEVKNGSLDEWIALLQHPPKGKIFVRNMFPSDEHRDEWFRTAHLRSDSEVRLLLRHFLVRTGSNRLDVIHAKVLINSIHNKTRMNELREHERRLLILAKSKGKYPVWEGLGWILDLLPQNPRMALSVVDAFFHANWDHLTDNYLSGLFDAEALIRNRYIESPQTDDSAERTLLSLDWRELEWLCGVLYEHMGFEVTVTPRGNDDGVDLFAKSQKRGEKTLIVVQSKKWSEKKPVGKRDIRELLGTIDHHRATKGVLVTTGRFESGAVKVAASDPRLELFDRNDFLQLLNEHCGSDWNHRVDRLLTTIKQESQEREN